MLAEQRGAEFISQLQKQNYQLGIFASAKLYSPEFDRTIFSQVDDLRLQSKGSSPRERDQNIRDEFLVCRKPYEKIIVHGHSVVEQPEFQINRIGIDTGAYFSGVLTCLVLEAQEQRIIQATC